MWSTLDEYYGDNSDYDWWKNRSLLRVPYPYMDIPGLLTTFGKQEDLKEKLVARLTGDREWSEPLFEVEIYEPYETVLDVTQMSSERLLRYEARIRYARRFTGKRQASTFNLHPRKLCNSR